MGEGDWIAKLCFLVPEFPLSVEDDILSLQDMFMFKQYKERKKNFLCWSLN